MTQHAANRVPDLLDIGRWVMCRVTRQPKALTHDKGDHYTAVSCNTTLEAAHFFDSGKMDGSKG